MTDHQERDTPWRLCWPTAQGRVARARLKTHPEDFRVDETLDRDTLMGHAGEHVCLYLEKTGDNTEYVARQLARIAGCRPLDIGFCGLKDRHAVTRQWFSLHRPGREEEDPDLVAAVASHWPVLAQGRAVRKLRRGEHAGNRFVIVLRDIEGDRAAIEEALNTLGRRGAPNYFGPQRFGHQGSNLTRALALDPDALKRRRGSSRNRRDKTHSERVMYFSAARAWLFNEVLAARVEAGHWDRCLEGEPAPPERAPTGPLWGDGGTLAEGPQGELERAVVARHPGFERLFSATRMAPERRPLVVRPEALAWRWREDAALEVEFRLRPGQYATTLLSDIFELEDMSLGRHNE
ncbi:tRNA pseudouridine(13) synthase TruD [uncultured Marinobacter sp.]|uniref:tRNA pseudouridine(13) synthase TruD n=1 Tax=uncultured Marinobacter sp. TaxID=187379 RepID=UPI000C4151C2|nr:pseudouridine synthase [Oceanospirillales bacterium]